MGAGSSHPIPVKPIIDYRLFYALPTRKGIGRCYNIAAAIPSESSSAYQATVRIHKSSKPDIELFYPATPGTILGSVRFLSDGKGSSSEIIAGDDEDGEEMVNVKSGTYAFTYGKTEYVWKITNRGLFGGVKEMTLRVRVDRDGEDREDEGETEEEGGEIMALWKTTSWLSKAQTAFWLKRKNMSLEEAKRWEIYVLLTGLGAIVVTEVN